MSETVGVPAEQTWSRAASVEERQTEIVRSLAALLRERPLSAISMQDVADRLGLTKGNLYYYFPSKHDLLFHCHLRGMQDSLRLLDAVAETDDPPADRLARLLHGLVLSVIEEPYGAVLATRLDVLPEDRRAGYLALRDRFEHGVRDLIAAGIDAGDFAPRDAKVVGLAVLGAINGIGTWFDPRGELDAGSIADTFTDFLVAGLRGPRSTSAG